MVFEAEKSLLRDYGHEVVEYARHSDEIRGQGVWGMLKGAASVPWSPFSARDLQKVLKREKPDVMHVHNSFPMLSPSIYYAAQSTNTASVLTLHNYRLFCAAGIPLREGQSCTLCLDQRSVMPAMKYGCYRGSRMATLPLAASIALHRAIGTWDNQVDAFISLTGFQRDTMVNAGLPSEKVHVKPQFYADPPQPEPWGKRRDKVVFIGRLGEEKGVRYLIDAWSQWGDSAPELEIIGDGPQSEMLKDLASKSSNIHFLGQIPFEKAQRKLANAKLLVVPSIWFEGFPMVIREAFALGVPVAASRLGSMASLVRDDENGVFFEPGSTDDLLRSVRSAWLDQTKLERMGKKARAIFDKEYTAETNHGLLINIYEQAISRRREVI
ncbi:glycosyltransferase family 4 protein [Mariprofundus sp. EBB-1]|uniref:glycosyltransferase family 4 protein n=1 Tax=Mariprofundus sp. EBB-1 TaxID=2650971 RepID=UPI001F25E81A|nr:glycosyltransferase family 4 protein [Mariprofundus sp. EBB-1]